MNVSHLNQSLLMNKVEFLKKTVFLARPETLPNNNKITVLACTQSKRQLNLRDLLAG